jgi:hypothetical protein
MQKPKHRAKFRILLSEPFSVVLLRRMLKNNNNNNNNTAKAQNENPRPIAKAT